MTLPGFWDEVAQIIGDKALAEVLYKYFMYISIGIAVAAIVVGGLVVGGLSLKVWFCDNEDVKKQLKLSRVKFVHSIGYILILFSFVQIVWNWVLPPILSWAFNK